MIVRRYEQGADCVLAIDAERKLVVEFRSPVSAPASYSLPSTPPAPLIIINPGTSTIVAERSAVGLRGVRRRA